MWRLMTTTTTEDRFHRMAEIQKAANDAARKLLDIPCTSRYLPADRLWSDEPFNWGDSEAREEMKRRGTHAPNQVCWVARDKSICEKIGDLHHHLPFAFEMGGTRKDQIDLKARLAVHVQRAVQQLAEQEWRGLVASRRRRRLYSANIYFSRYTLLVCNR